MHTAGKSKLVWLSVLVAVGSMSFGASQIFTRHTKPAKTIDLSGDANAAAPKPRVMTRDAKGVTTAAADQSPTRNAVIAAAAGVSPDAQSFINRHFANQVYPEVTMLPNLQRDNPAEYERLVREHFPEFAKAQNEAASAEQAAAAQRAAETAQAQPR